MNEFYTRSLLSIKESWHSLVTAVNYFVNPPFCLACKKLDVACKHSILCGVCMYNVHPVVSTFIKISTNCTMTVFAVSVYKEPLKSLILAKMYSDIAVSVQLGKLIWQTTNIGNTAPDLFVPIPLHWRRYAQRGYNQTEEMARAMTQESGIATVNLLQRPKNTAFQFGLSGSARKENIQSAFVINPAVDKKLYEDKHIVLVDDLMTTGTTLQEAAKQLLALKPKKISAVVVCRVI